MRLVPDEAPPREVSYPIVWRLRISIQSAISLLFERFLNPERVSMPDIDIDFCYERRQEVIDYVARKYGSDRVVQIVTFGTMAARGVIRDVGRVMDLPYSLCDQVAKMIPQELNITIDEGSADEPGAEESV